jgi:hypothetical protein
MTPFDPEPLAPEALDELLSADIDDAFDTAARDLGMEPSVARARVDATPGATERKAALVRARDALQEAPRLDEVAHARVVRNAMNTVAPSRERSGRLRSALLTGATIAAAIALIIGLVAVLANGNSNSSSSSNAATATTANIAAGSNAKPSNHLENDADVRAYAEHALRVQHGSAASTTVAPSTDRFTNDSLKSTQDAANAAEQTKTANSCVMQLATTFGVAPAPKVATNVVYQGTPARLVVFVERGRTITVVFVPSTCRPLVEQLER